MTKSSDTFDLILKWFFIASSVFYFVTFTEQISKGEPYFDSLMSFLIEALAALYFIKKPNIAWAKENMFFLLATLTGLMMTKSFFYYYHGMDYVIYTILSSFLLFSSFVSFKKYQLEH